MEKLYKIYFSLPNFKRYGFFGKAFNKIVQKFMKLYLDNTVPNHLIQTSSKQGSGINEEKRNLKYIISLTSFPARIEEIWITIDLILRQSFKADEVVLWLSEEQFAGVPIPDSLLRLCDRGLQIRFCDDLRSHKKYYYAMKENSDAVVITVDDDVYYPKDFIKKLIEFHIKFPDVIVANKAHRVKFSDGVMLPYKKWEHNCKTVRVPSHLLVGVGVGGVLYPVNALSTSVFEKEIFKEICFFADDLWLKMNAVVNDTKVVATDYYNKDFITIGKSQRQKLTTQNALKGGNDVQLKALLSHYKIDFRDYQNDNLEKSVNSFLKSY